VPKKRQKKRQKKSVPKRKNRHPQPNKRKQQPERIKKNRKSNRPSSARSRRKRRKRRPGEKPRHAGREIPVPAGPATRRLARKLNVELEQVEGTGEPGGRVMPEDVVRAHLVQSPGASAPELPDFDKFGPTERSERNKIAQVATEHLARSWRLIPHVTQHGRADLTDLEKARRDYNENAGDGAAKVTPTALVAAAVVAALKEFPQFNSSLDAQRNELILKRYYHIGFAVDTEQGLLVPVIRDVDQKSIQDVAGELAELAEKARARQLKKEQMEGGTFTISNQGGIGGASFTPIVNWPEVAILGLSRAEMTVKLRDGSPVERLILPLSLSYDHRVINGADAARFIVRLSELLSDFETLLIET